MSIALRIFLIVGLLSFFCSGPALSAQSISKNGYPEHFIGGAVVSGTVSYFTVRKTNNKAMSWFLGFASAALAGGLKEALDHTILNRTRNPKDFNYTTLGGLVGASIVIPLRSKKKDDPPISRAF